MPGLTVPADWSLGLARAGDNMGVCPSQVFGRLPASVTGTVEWVRLAGKFPSAVNIDTWSFEPGDAAVPASEPMTAQNVDARAYCEPFVAPPDD